MGQQAFDTEKRLNGFFFKPDEPVIYGIDEKGDVGRHLWVPDVEAPLPKEMIDSIRAKGIETPIEVQKIDGKAFVVKGRTRVRIARYLKEKEGIDILIPAVLARKGQTQSELMAGIMAENLQRKNVHTFDLMEQMAYFIKLNGDDDVTMQQLKNATGHDKRRVEKLMRVRESKPVYDAIKTGVIDRVEAAVAFAEMPMDQQVKEIAELKALRESGGAASPAKSGGAVEYARARKMGRYPRLTFSRTNKILNGFERENLFDKESLQLMRFFNGQVKFDSLSQQLQEAIKAAETKPKKQRAAKAAKAPKKKASKKKR